MKTITREELNKILRKHRIWLKDPNAEDAEKADFKWANFRRADFKGANLRGAALRGAEYGSLQCPEEGSFIAFKKCENNTIVKLLIPEDAKRSSATSRKCRASKAVVLEITNLN